MTRAPKPKRKTDGWNASLIQPITAPDGQTIETLADARAYILALPKARQGDAAVQKCIAGLMLAAERPGLELLAQAHIARLVHGEPKLIGKKDRPWGKRQLARDG